MYLQFPYSNQGDKEATQKWHVFVSTQILSAQCLMCIYRVKIRRTTNTIKYAFASYIWFVDISMRITLQAQSLATYLQ